MNSVNIETVIIKVIILNEGTYISQEKTPFNVFLFSGMKDTQWCEYCSKKKIMSVLTQFCKEKENERKSTKCKIL